MQYLEFTFELTPPSADFLDILEAVLADVGFDSFVKGDDANVSAADASGSTGDVVFTPRTALPEGEHADGCELKAYIKAADWDEAALRSALEAFTLDFPAYSVVYTAPVAVEDRDWNAEWEKNYFTPLVVDDRCVVSATFHHDVPRAEYNITINPRMSFGTGHHETTRQMLSRLLTADLADKDVLDMGCGTSILGILAALRGARRVTAIDVDPWCVENSRENAALNGLANIDVSQGDAGSLPREETFDLVLANIHLNIIVRDLPAYAACLRSGGLFFTSGFYRRDLPQVQAAAEALGLRFLDATDQSDWCCAAFRK